MLTLNKTKAALPGRLSHTTNNAQDITTLVELNQSTKKCFGCNPLILRQSPILSSGQPSGASLGFRRWRRLISPRNAETINCPVLSFGSLTFSISSITSCGTRDAICVDLLLLRPVAISNPQCIRWLALYTKKNRKKGLRWLAPLCKVVSTLIKSRYINGNAPDCWSSTEASNHKPLYKVTIMANIQSTQTYPKFQYLFRAVARADMAAGAVNVSVEAGTLVEARQKIKKGYIAAFYRGCKRAHSTTPRRRLINPVMLAEAQDWVKNCPGTWIWKLAVHRMKEAYGIIEPKPFPEVGDTNGNFVCVHSDPANEDYVFLSKYKVEGVNHA